LRASNRQAISPDRNAARSASGERPIPHLHDP
jgi:hypothetical protein